jgi:formylmethanofuran dehydrogenase subunit E
MSNLTEEYINQIQSFHGHMCPGLAMGIQASQIALDLIGPHSMDEEVVAVVETDMCAVDAVQFMTGCTFGKGNLIHQDYGKNAYTFIRRSDNKAVRVISKPNSWGDPNDEHRQLFAKIRAGSATPPERERFQELHLSKSKRILETPLEDLFDYTEFEMTPPKKARIHTSIECAKCGEGAMETRIRRFGGQDLCIPCFEKSQLG